MEDIVVLIFYFEFHSDLFECIFSFLLALENGSFIVLNIRPIIDGKGYQFFAVIDIPSITLLGL